jgi:hypothetical protein
MGGSPGRYGTKQVARNDSIGGSTAYSFIRTVAEGINAAGPHITVAAADAEQSETALGFLFFKPIPGNLYTVFFSLRKHDPGCGINAFLGMFMLIHLFTSPWVLNDNGQYIHYVLTFQAPKVFQVLSGTKFL